LRAKVLFFHTPEFFPPLDFFFGLLNSDIWVVLDHVTFTSRSRQSRCRIKTGSGVKLLALAVKRPCNKHICNMVIDNVQPWRKEFLKAVQQNYFGSAFFEDYYEELRDHVEAPHVLMETFTLETCIWIADLMGKHVDFIRTCDSYKRFPVSKIIPLLMDKLGGEPFSETFTPPQYTQQTEPFERDLSVLDPLFCIGATNTRKLLTGNPP
jgi:hypothetical protein